MSNKKRIVVLSGAGISAESGLKTFRDSGGLWEGYDMMQVASIESWYSNKELMLDFYNQRRKQAAEVLPNAGHKALAGLEEKYDVVVITQNVDDLHEKAGSSNVVHLHGKLSEVRSSVDESLVYDIGEKEIKLGDTCSKGSQLRPNVVWFGEPVPEFERASELMQTADICIIVGTSLVVYPAASLIHDAPYDADIYIVDPVVPDSVARDKRIKVIKKMAGEGLPELAKILKEQ